MRALTLSVVLVSAGVILTGCGGGDDVPITTGRFVGEALDGNTFVALVASTPTGSGSSRQVRAFVCDGAQVNEWFTGSVTGNFVNLTSDDGDSQFSATFFAGQAEGSVTLSNSQTLNFTLVPASGLAGLYDVTIHDDSSVTGSSGAFDLDALITNEVQDSRNVVVGTIESGATTLDFEALATPDSDGEQRWIVLSDGRIKGGFKRLLGSGFIEPTSNL